MASSLKDRLVKKLNAVCGKPKMEPEIIGLDVDSLNVFFEDNFDIEIDSCPGVAEWLPAMNEDAIRKLAADIDDPDAISIVFLLTNDVEQVSLKISVQSINVKFCKSNP